MIACRISQIGTSTVGTNDHGACCIASEPGPANSCKGEPSAEVMPKGDRQHEIGGAEQVPGRDRRGVARAPLLQEPQYRHRDDARDDVAPGGAVRERAREPSLGRQQEKQHGEDAHDVECDHRGHRHA